MQDIKKILQGQNPAIIPGEDLERTLRLAEAGKERERVELFNQGEIALDNAAYNGTDTIVTGTGKMIQNNRAQNNKFKSLQEFGRLGLGSILDAMMAAGASLAAIQEAAQVLMSPTGAFGVAAAKTFARTPDFYEDETHIYETEHVSREAHRVLATEVARVRSLERDIRSITDPDRCTAKKAELQELISEYGMRLHPVSGKYVHSVERVAEEEARFNPDNQLERKDAVCVYRIKISAHDSRKRSVVLGDQFDQQTIEVIATDSDHAQSEARPIAPPEFHHI